MKLLIITPYLPYPLDSGGNNAQFFMIEYLREKMEVTLICPHAKKEHFIELSQKWSNVKIIVLFFSENIIEKRKNNFEKMKYYLLHPSAIAARLKNKRTSNHKNTNTPQQHVFKPDSSKMQYSKFQFIQINKLVINKIAEHISENTYNFIQIEFINLLPLVFLLPYNVHKIFVHHEIGFVRNQREVETLENPEPNDWYIVNKNKAHELSYLKHFNSIITFSTTDKFVLEKNLHSQNIFTSPFPMKKYDSLNQTNFELENLVYLGGESHYPNKDALEWFIFNIYEYISEMFPKIKLKIIGKWTEQTIAAHRTNEKIHFLGYVDDLFANLKNCALIVPLRIGSGIRAKILEAFAMGIPVISSSVGIEGIAATENLHYLKAENRDDYMKAIKILTNSPNKAEELTKNAMKDVVPIYEINNCGKIRYELYQKLATT